MSRDQHSKYSWDLEDDGALAKEAIEILDKNRAQLHTVLRRFDAYKPAERRDARRRCVDEFLMLIAENSGVTSDLVHPGSHKHRVRERDQLARHLQVTTGNLLKSPNPYLAPNSSNPPMRLAPAPPMVPMMNGGYSHNDQPPFQPFGGFPQHQQGPPSQYVHPSMPRSSPAPPNLAPPVSAGARSLPLGSPHVPAPSPAPATLHVPAPSPAPVVPSPAPALAPSPAPALAPSPATAFAPPPAPAPAPSPAPASGPSPAPATSPFFPAPSPNLPAPPRTVSPLTLGSAVGHIVIPVATTRGLSDAPSPVPSNGQRKVSPPESRKGSPPLPKSSPAKSEAPPPAAVVEPAPKVPSPQPVQRSVPVYVAIPENSLLLEINSLAGHIEEAPGSPAVPPPASPAVSTGTARRRELRSPPRGGQPGTPNYGGGAPSPSVSPSRLPPYLAAHAPTLDSTPHRPDRPRPGPIPIPIPFPTPVLQVTNPTPEAFETEGEIPAFNYESHSPRVGYGTILETVPEAEEPSGREYDVQHGKGKGEGREQGPGHTTEMEPVEEWSGQFSTWCIPGDAGPVSCDAENGGNVSGDRQGAVSRFGVESPKGETKPGKT